MQAFATRLEIRLAVTVGLGLLVFALVAGLFTYQRAYRDELDRALEFQKQLVASVQTQAEVAVFAVDSVIADGVIAGLLATPLISEVRIESSRGEFQAGSEKSGNPNNYVYPLYSPINNQERIGDIAIIQNTAHVDAIAVKAALYQTGLLLLQVFVAVVIMAAVIRLLVLKPINRLSRTLSNIRPGSKRRLRIDPLHQRDQIGALSMSANALLDIAESHMDESDRINASLQEALAKLTEKEQAKSNFFAAASHDLRQPIHAIRLFLDALRRDDSQESKAKLIDSLEASSQSLNDLLDALLDISKLDAGAVIPEPELVSLDEIFDRLDANFSALALKRKLRFKLWFPQRPLMLRTDRRLLNIILANLTGNALKNTLHGGVLVGFRRRGNEYVFQVFDTGIGIETEHLERIYEEFYQINNPNRDRAKGLGLGLAIARRVSRLLDYRIGCRSVVGRGSVFEIGIPLDALQTTAGGTLLAVDDTSVDLERFRGKRFVVLEDDALVAAALKEWLLGIGGQVSSFALAESALASPGIMHADYFLVDYQLAGEMNGLAFLEALSRRRTTPIRAVVVSGNTTSRFIEDTDRLHWPVMFKPADPEQMLAKLSQQG